MVLEKLVSRNAARSLKFCRAVSCQSLLQYHTKRKPLHLQPCVTSRISFKTCSISFAPALQSEETTESAATPEVYCVMVKNLPFKVTKSDVQDLFYDVEIAPRDVYIESRDGDRTGVCFVYVKSKEDYENCMKKRGDTVGDRPAGVFPGPTMSPSQLFADRFAVRLHGLPFNVTVAEIADFLAGVNIVPNGVHIQGAPGSRTGVGVVEVETEDDLNEALKKDKLFLGQRYIQVSEYWETNLRDIGRAPAPGMNRRVKTDYGVILRGLPYDASSRDIHHFLSGVNVSSVEFQRDGICLVYVESEADVETALGRNNEYIGRRYIEVRRMDHDGSPQLVGTVSQYSVVLRGYPFGTKEEQIRTFLEDVNISGLMLTRNSCVVYVNSDEDVQKALAKNREYIGHRYVDVMQQSRQGEMDMDAFL